MGCVELLDGENVLDIEQAGYQRPLDPAEFLVRLDLQHRRSGCRTRCAGGLDCHFEPCPGLGFAAGAMNERVPLWKPGEIGQEVPYPFSRCVNSHFVLARIHDIPLGYCGIFWMLLLDCCPQPPIPIRAGTTVSIGAQMQRGRMRAEVAVVDVRAATASPTYPYAFSPSPSDPISINSRSIAARPCHARWHS